MRKPYYETDEVERVEREAGESHWWEKPKRKSDEHESKVRATDLWSTVRSLEEVQSPAHEQFLWNARLYSNRELANFDWGHHGYQMSSLSPVSLLGENLVLSVVDTYASLVGKNRTKCTPVPRGASYKTTRLAKKMDKWLQGEFDRQKIYTKMQEAFLDGLIFGFGVIKITNGDEGLEVTKVFPDNFMVDQSESVATTGRPHHAYERHCLRVEEVEARYGLKAGSLQGNKLTGWLPYRSPGRGYVIVVEGYRAECYGTPGRHVVAVEDQLLVDEEWDDELPYLWFHPVQMPGGGFYGPSVVEQVLPYQVRLNEINEVIRDAQDLMARPRILVAEGSRINPQDIDNVIGRILKYTGIKPEALTWDAASPELYGERDHQVMSCFDQFGLGQLVSQAKLPGSARLDSSLALQEATSVTDDRIGTLIARWEEFFLDVAKKMLAVQAESANDTVVTWYSGGKGAAETIKWSEVDMDRDCYTLTISAASVFSLTPAARRDKLEGWYAKGLITLAQFWEYSGHPDIESVESNQAAAAADIRRTIEDMEDGKNRTPDPMQDLINGVEMVSRRYNRLKADFDDVPVKVLVNFTKWVAMARALMVQGSQTPDNQGLGGAPAGGPAPAVIQPPVPMPSPGPMPVAGPGMMPAGGPGMM